MLPRRDAPFPIEEVRDLLGLARALYRSERAARAPQLRLEKIARVGKLLSDAIELHATSPRNSVGHRAAWVHAEDAARELGELVELLVQAEPIVRAAMGAVRNRR